MPLHRLAAIVLLAAGGFGVAHAAAALQAPAAGTTTWPSTWNSALQESISMSGRTNQTFRMVTRVSLGGTSLRVHLADPFGSTPVQFGHVSLGSPGENRLSGAIRDP